MTAPMNRREFTSLLLAAGAVPGGSQAADVEQRNLIVNGLDPSAARSEYLDLLKAGGVSCWYRSEDGAGIEDFASVLTFCDQNAGRIAVARSVDDIWALHRQGKMSYIVGWQSAEALALQASIDPALSHLRAYHELGLRICGIAYNVANLFGGGCLEPQVGLTRAGRRLVEEIHRLRIILDVGGHTSEQTSLDALEMSKGVPVICSHTNIKTLNDNPRNTSDRVIEAIARSGGVIGLSAFNDFHARRRSDASVPRTPQVALDRHLDQYDYLKRLVGVDHIGLGPDFIEGNNGEGVVSPDTTTMVAEAYSSQRPWYYVQGFENIGQLPNVTRGLLSRGWTTTEVHKVLGGNWLRVYRQIWGR
ncbi:dipeptidase [Steroidobacter sp.]|uniref:dipeptidase n=1 Tax=Steroidobacter sp. TaxID=1978227 RepID=UPI001A45A66B|nr:membrane dipeptidase [Steroidobacter sp.]MBL8268539.1 membrane dipeptidase [Steroidobacter sp.]